MSTATATAPATRDYASTARVRKAAKIAAVLRTIGATAADIVVDEFTADDRRAAEQVAGVNPSSDQTWRVVANMLAGSADADALCQTCGIGDPLGVDGPRKTWGHDGPCAR